MDIILQLAINGLLAGSIYALIGSGFSLIYQTNRFMHLAHGGVIAASAYLFFALSTDEAISPLVPGLSGAVLTPWSSIPLTLIGGALIGVGVYTLLYRPLKHRGAGNATLLVASIAILLLFENLLLLLFGSEVRTIALPAALSSSFSVNGASLTWANIAIFASTIVIFVAIWLFATRSRTGRIMRAVADNAELARISGVNAERVRLYSFALGSALGALAAVFYSATFNVQPVMGTLLVVKGFAAAIIGGITSLPGAVLGGYVLGVGENVGIWYLPSGFKDAIAFLLLFAFLLFRPAGILGIQKGARD